MMKNKYQEALDGFESVYRNVTLDDELTNEKRDLIQGLIDKETPMKLVGDMYHRRCRLCGNQNLNTKWTYGNYCSGCGQKIDWSDEE